MVVYVAYGASGQEQGSHSSDMILAFLGLGAKRQD